MLRWRIRGTDRRTGTTAQGRSSPLGAGGIQWMGVCGGCQGAPLGRATATVSHTAFPLICAWGRREGAHGSPGALSPRRVAMRGCRAGRLGMCAGLRGRPAGQVPLLLSALISTLALELGFIGPIIGHYCLETVPETRKFAVQIISTSGFI